MHFGRIGCLSLTLFTNQGVSSFVWRENYVNNDKFMVDLSMPGLHLLFVFFYVTFFIVMEDENDGF